MPASVSHGKRPPWASIAIESDIAALEAPWRALEATALVTPYQAYGWVRPFVETVGAAEGLAFRYALLRDAAGEVLALLPLVIARRYGARFAAFIGDKHANYHMGIYAPAFAAGLDADLAGRMLREIGSALGGLDAFLFLNQPRSWQGIANPATLLGAVPSPSLAYKLTLVSGDSEAAMKRAMSSHARKKLKNKHNRFRDFGPSALTHATTPAEIERVLDAFLAQKAERFRAMGVEDPFASPSIRAFLTNAATASGPKPPAIEIYALDLAGTCVATFIVAVQGGRISGMATSFDLASPTAKTSPGEILLSELVRRKSSEGFTVFDLGVGEARYKTTFCDDRDELVDTFLPLTLKGQFLTAAARARGALKRRVKNSPMALKLARAIAGRMPGKAAAETE